MAGLLPWMAFHEGVGAPTALTDNAAMVKKTVFPLETLVLSVVLAAVVNEVIAFAIFAASSLARPSLPSPWLLLAVPALLTQATLTFGVGCLVATVTTFVPESRQRRRAVVPLIWPRLDEMSPRCRPCSAPAH